MATYFHHQHHHHNNHHHSHHGNASDIIAPQAADGGLQTLILMNHPNFVGYSEQSHAPTLYHAPPPLLPQLIGVPLHSSSESYAPHHASHAQQHYAAWAQRESPRAQQGLSLTLSSNQNHSFSRAAHPEPDHLHPSHSGGSESPAATVASAGDMTALMTPSKYLKAAQELLEEVVNVSVDRVKSESFKKIKTKGESPPANDSVAGDGSKEAVELTLTPVDKQELQMKKAKLINLLDEVEQRQRQYQQQMQSVVASFEQVAGANSARTYTSLALKTISSQFRCLRVAISGQIRAVNKALGEGEGGSSTSRLKILDHQMRQQRALQQLGMMQNNAWRPQRGLPEKAVSVLRAWLFEHFLHPYPKDSDKMLLAKQTGLSRSQVSNWFINARVRLWKPMIEEMYAEEVKDHEQQNNPDNKDEQEDENDHDHKLGDDQAKAEENHSTSNLNGNDPFGLVDNEAQGSCLKKQRNNDFTFTDPELFYNGCKEEADHHHTNKQDDECSMMPGSGSGFIGGLVSYPIGQFPANFSGNGVSLTLGLPHCEGSLSLQGNNHAFLPNNSDIDQYRGRLEMGQLNPNSSHSGNPYAAQLLHDFVA